MSVRLSRNTIEEIMEGDKGSKLLSFVLSAETINSIEEFQKRSREGRTIKSICIVLYCSIGVGEVI